MARLLDLTEEEDGEAEAEADQGGERDAAVADSRHNPNVGKCSASLGCYPPEDVQLRLFSRSPCSCDDQVWICQPCGQTSRNADTTYMRGWAWRARYSVCGGLGAGLGEANEGVECGRDSECLAAREVFHEHDCDEDGLENEMANAEIDSRHMHGSSYTTQEIVGIGGRVKRKVKKRVYVGAIVKEYEDERLNGKFLSREQNGANRSWCSWCCRVVPGKKDADNSASSTDSTVSSASSIST
ncbi:hypothetical protein KC355_g4838 [Hortaea werneckii]|nr:hypothetical protein KC355_g4838 [Hortaea werneckii]